MVRRNAPAPAVSKQAELALSKDNLSEHVSIQVLEPSPSSISGHAHEKPQNDDRVIVASIKMNLLLLVGKVLACAMATSPVIVATLVDSTIDVLVQMALYWANQTARPEARAASSSMYPAGRGQLEPVSVVVCAALKCAGMMAVAVEAVGDLYHGDPHMGRDKHGLQHIWRRHFEAVCTLAVLSATKFAFCLWCELVVRGRRDTSTETVRAVLVDNQNDVVLSVGALVVRECGVSTRSRHAADGGLPTANEVLARSSRACAGIGDHATRRPLLVGGRCGGARARVVHHRALGRAGPGTGRAHHRASCGFILPRDGARHRGDARPVDDARRGEQCSQLFARMPWAQALCGFVRSLAACHPV